MLCNYGNILKLKKSSSLILLHYLKLFQKTEIEKIETSIGNKI